MLFKIIVLILMIAVVIALGSALVGLVKGNGDKRRVVRSLTWRVALAAALLLVLAVGYLTGQLQPHGVMP